MVGSTLLPSLLRTDAAAGRRHGVSLWVAMMSYTSLATAVILVAAQVLAPIGLSEAIRSGEPVNASFAYAPDPSIFREATFSRDHYAPSRACGAGTRPCPGVADLSSHIK